MSGIGRETRWSDRHPDTGVRLTDQILPDWAKVRDVVLSGAAVIPGLPMQAWDVALTDRGPILLEVNAIGSFILPQMARGAGLLNEELREFFVEIGVPGSGGQPCAGGRPRTISWLATGQGENAAWRGVVTWQSRRFALVDGLSLWRPRGWEVLV